MKKTILSILFVLLMVVAVGCGGGKRPKKTLTPDDFYAYLVSTVDEYKASSSGNLLVEMDTGDVTTLEYVYNYDGSSLDSLLCVLQKGDTLMAAYVKDKVSYINVNNEKTQAQLTNEEEANILDNYGFEAMLGSIFATFDKSLFNALVVESDAEGLVQLKWDSSKYVLISTGLSDDEFIEASDRYDSISASMDDIVIKLTYADQKITKIESTWTKNDKSVGTINVSFKGSSSQVITYPSDLSSYSPID